MVFLIVLWLAMFIAMTVLLVLIVTTLVQGIAARSAAVHRVPGLVAGSAGARPAILGSIWVIGTTAVLAIPLVSRRPSSSRNSPTRQNGSTI